MTVAMARNERRVKSRQPIASSTRSNVSKVSLMGLAAGHWAYQNCGKGTLGAISQSLRAAYSGNASAFDRLSCLALESLYAFVTSILSVNEGGRTTETHISSH